jgi:hypothetical protein
VISWFKQSDLPHERPAVQTLRSPADSDGLVADSFYICADFHRRNHRSHIGGNWMKSKQQTDSLLVDLLFKPVDLVIFSDNLVAEFAVAA